MRISIPSNHGVTMIENRFIDQYMPEANGEFVKVYLYLLRCAGSGRESSVSSIADFLDHTDKDVLRALKYWEKIGLLQITYDHDHTPQGLAFVMPAEEVTQAKPVQESAPAAADPALPTDPAEHAGSASGLQEAGKAKHQKAPAQSELPHRINPAAARKKELKEQQDFAQLIFVGESYLSRPMKSQEINNLIYFYDDLHFSSDLIEYLLEYCAEKGNPGPNYMEKVAQEWYKAGITTPAQAKAASHAYRQEYYTIFRCLGISNHKPSESEMALMDKWLGEFGFSMDIIKDACGRTVLGAGKPDFRYADSILTSWQKKGVKTKEDISKLDSRADTHATHQNQSSSKTTKPFRTSRTRANANNRFNNFEQQRTYDWEDLTAKLLQSSEGN